MGWIADLLKEIPSAARYKAELEEMETQNTELQQKVIFLELELKKLRQEIQRRDDIIQKEKSHNDLLDEIKVNILVLLSKYDKPNTDQIASTLKTHLEIMKFHLTELKHMKMIHDLLTMGAPTRWMLTHEGRKYLIENKLIS